MGLALPLILANVTTPLLGLVDTAILGKMDDVSVLAGAAIGSMIITQIYWVCGFLKMSITGLSAQSIVGEDLAKLKVMIQGFGLALGLALILIFLHQYILDLGLHLANTKTAVSDNAQAYFDVRVLGAPAALMNMVLIGWLIGQQKSKWVLFLQLLINISNIIASLLFVYVFGWGVEGVAFATVFAEYLMLVCGLVFAKKFLIGQSTSQLIVGQSKSKLDYLSDWFSWANIRFLLNLNKHIFVRNLALQFTIAFITLKGAHYGVLAVAANAILMQFFSLIALGLDGIANAVEALVGEAKGKKELKQIRQQVKLGLLWSSMVALAYSVGFYFLDSLIINLLTHHAELVQEMRAYTLIIVLMPLIAHWCFLFDGVFVGLSLGRAMQNTMLASTLVGFLPTWFILQNTGNQSLWWAMLVFLFCRGFFLALSFVHYYKNRQTLLLN